MFYGVLEDAP